MHVALVSWTGVATRAVASVCCATDLGARVTVLDLDGSLAADALPRDLVTVRRPADLGVAEEGVRRAALACGAEAVARALAPRLVAPDGRTLLVRAGVLLLDEPVELLAAAATAGWAAVARDPGPQDADGRHPDAADLDARGHADDALVAVRGDATEVLARWTVLAGGSAGDLAHGLGASPPPADPPVPLLDALADELPGALVADPALLVGAWTLRPEHRLAGDPLTLDGRRVRAVDLARLDTDRPWLLDPALGDPRGRLSDHPLLAALVAGRAEAWRAAPAPGGSWDPDRTSSGTAVDDTLRCAAALPGAPDLLDPDAADAALAWLVRRGADGSLPPYLRALRERPDLAAAFPHVPGGDEPAFLAWARAHAVADGAPAALVLPALGAAGAPTTTPGPAPLSSRAPAPRPRAGRGPRPTPGVNVVGFLGSEVGIGESARLVTAALGAAGVPFSATAVDRFAQSRPTSARVEGATDGPFDTTVLCVNADLTPAVAGVVGTLLARSHRIGMWYWEVEDFPATQHGGFDVLDEVWVATEFVRRAVEPHSPVPVRTLLPPLPQRSAVPLPERTTLGLPDRPYLLFSFDFLSTAERKNPLGVLEAFVRAFRPDEGPLLVLKSINADRRPDRAEQLRLAAAGRPDVLLLERHLPVDARDALVAHCLAYVSLHRAEGLGLTMAEAMAWGRPVVATGYSGNLDFMTDENSLLVPWHEARIPDDAAPYPPGGRWAEPDLDAAAAALRLVWERPDEAAARGARAAHDIATLHSPAAAGARFAARLAELEPARRAAARRSPAAGLARTARALARRVLR